MGLRDLSRGIRNAMFAERESIPEAHEYAMQIAKACGRNEAGVITAVHVILNTIAKVLDQYAADEEALVAAATEAMEFADSVLIEGEGGDNFPFKALREALAGITGIRKCVKCKTSFEGYEGGIDCTGCNGWFCDDCYDTGKGDGCHCHAHEPTGIEGQDRESYGDDQDRKNYTA